MAKYNDAYQTIAEMFTFPESENFRKMLQALVTKEEAELLLECRSPITVSELAARLKSRVPYAARVWAVNQTGICGAEIVASARMQTCKSNQRVSDVFRIGTSIGYHMNMSEHVASE